jgi:hypothetical protein
MFVRIMVIQVVEVATVMAVEATAVAADLVHLNQAR